MKTLNFENWRGRIQSRTPPAGLIASFVIVCLLMQEPAWGAGTVTNCTESNLRAAMAGGGTVTFACNGTITLGGTISNTANTVLDGTGHQIAISGSNTVRVFYVSTNVTFTLFNLSVANGRSGSGAGIFNAGGTVTLVGDAFQTNMAYWDGVSPLPMGGGAIFNQSGAVFATNCTFLDNQAALGPSETNPPSLGGGAIRNEGGNLALLSCVFAGNQALGCDETNSWSGGDALGGAIFNDGTNVIDLCAFSRNSTFGGYGGSAGGGAIYNDGSLSVARSSLTNNSAWGGAGQCGVPAGPGGAANGGAIGNSGVLWLQSSTLAANATTGGVGAPGEPGGSSYPVGQYGLPGGVGGSASGGLFNAGTANLVNDTVALNSACGGNGGPGGAGGNSTAWNGGGGIGGAGGEGGTGCGGIGDLSGRLQITNCTVASNSAVAGLGGSGGPPGLPAGAPPGATGSSGVPVGGVSVGSCVIANTLLAGNIPTNCLGTTTDVGHNLSSDGSCAFGGRGSMNNQDPRLGPLANNGGPTFTMALLPGSPAIDAGSAVRAPATDQRGVPRPQGPGVDIGTFEYQYLPTFTGMTIQNDANRQLQVCGLWSNETFTVQISSNLVVWLDATDSVACTNGMFQIVDPVPVTCPLRFYRLKTSAP